MDKKSLEKAILETQAILNDLTVYDPGNRKEIDKLESEKQKLIKELWTLTKK